MTQPPSPQFVRLTKVAEAVEVYATSLAYTLGNFHGTNDFGLHGHSLWNGFVIEEMQRDLLAMMVVLASGLLAPNPQATDATLIRAREIVQIPAVRLEVGKFAREWVSDGITADTDQKNALSRVDKFESEIALIDTASLKKHRDWMLAHSTTKTAPKMMMQEVWDIAAATLQSAGDLCFFALGKARDFAEITQIHRDQALSFWENFKIESVATD